MTVGTTFPTKSPLIYSVTKTCFTQTFLLVPPNVFRYPIMGDDYINREATTPVESFGGPPPRRCLGTHYPVMGDEYIDMYSRL